MHNVYVVCLIVGLVVPLFSLVFSLFDGFVDAISVDALEVGVGDIDINLLPLSANALSMWALIFGGVGLNCESTLSVGVCFGISLISGYLCAVSLQTLVEKLRKRQQLAPEAEQLIGKTCTVANDILEGSFGAVMYIWKDGSKVTYPAKSFDGGLIKQDTEVIVDSKEGMYLVVSLLDKDNN